MAVKLLIDSASDISKAEAEKLGVYMLPMPITFGNQEYLDGIDLLPSDFYDKLEQSDALPKTSRISSFRFEEAFEEYTKNGDQLIVILLSSELSGTCSGAQEVAKKFAGKVYVIDSLNAAIGERLLAQYALQLIDRGMQAKDIADELQKAKSRLKLFAVIDTLEYLKKGGRVSAATAFAGTLLSIKPIISVVDGRVEIVGKAMGTKKATKQLVSLIEQAGIDFSMPYGCIWSGNDNSKLTKFLQDHPHVWQDGLDVLPKYMLGGTIGTHIGPGGLGVAFFQK